MNELEVKKDTNVALFDNSKIKLMKETICKGATDQEFELFLHACQRTGLDPFARQIYAVKRWDSNLKRESMTVQTGIDGYRLIADRTGKYAPGRETTYAYRSDGSLLSATAYIKKMTSDGTWHEISATAFFEEYCQKTKDGKPMSLWNKLPHVMIAKCFDSETYVLTEYGFKKFSEVNGRIMQVTENGLEPVDAKPFCQDYFGEMIAYEGRDLDFCVTPNHDMITTSGKIEAGLMYDQAVSRPSFWIPRIVSEDKGKGIGFTKEQCELAAACLCDGDYMSTKSFRIKVSRPHKIRKILSWDLHIRETTRQLAGKQCKSWGSDRIITTKNDQIEFSFSMDSISPLVIPYKRLNHEMMLKMNSQEARWFIDAWAFFDGNVNSGGGTDRTLRIWSSDLQYLSWLEILGIKAGYTVSQRQPRYSDISTKANYCISFSEINEISVCKWGEGVSKYSRQKLSLKKTNNESGKVWCVTVPSGAIVVRRNSFSMICGNCAEAVALRRAFPAELSGIYTQEEMPMDEVKPVVVDRTPISKEQAKVLANMIDIDEAFKKRIMDGLLKFGITSLEQVTQDLYPKLIQASNNYFESKMDKEHVVEEKDVE